MGLRIETSSSSSKSDADESVRILDQREVQQINNEIGNEEVNANEVMEGETKKVLIPSHSAQHLQDPILSKSVS